MNSLDTYLKGDKVIWLVVLLLSLISILAVYSSTGSLAYRYQSGNTEFYLYKHIFIIVFGLGLMWAFHQIPYKYFSPLSQLGIGLGVLLLFLTFFMGASINQASRWLVIPGINITFQPSDIAKLSLIMYLARVMSRSKEKLSDNKWVALHIMLPVFGICALIVRSNFSTAAVLFVTCLILLFIGRLNYRYLFQMIGISLAGIVFIVLLGKAFPQAMPRLATWEQRVEDFMKGKSSDDNSEEQYQVEQAKIAIATGGLLGKGPGHSDQRYFLPQSYSDFIYAIIIEEYGLFFGIFVLFLYLIILFRGIRIVIKCNHTFGALLAMGCTFSLIFQGLINMAVASNLFPVTGQPLPFLSMGGTSIWFSSIAVGIILSVSRLDEKNESSEELEINNQIDDSIVPPFEV
ncbi:MAG: FtsW/RodA/SpoVE family cell cycle protein [Bacteroidia bacterium]|nr:FtsW/RodA/SpoVE family cell cycle protein [Bacteroidia bacterium]